MADPEVKRLSNLEILLYPLLKRLTPPERRDWLELSLKYSKEERARERLQAQTRAQVLKEARVFGELMISRWASLGAYYRPKTELATPEPSKRMKAQKVSFEYIFAESERIDYKIRTRERRLWRNRTSLPYKVRVGDLISEETIQELSIALERTVQAKQENYMRGAWVIVNRLEGVDGLPLKITFSQLLRHYPEDVSGAPIILGVGQHRYIHTLPLASYPHALIAGSSGGGKSNMVNNIIASLMRFTDPESLKFILIDLKRMEFPFYEGAPHLMRPIVTEAEEAIEQLQSLVDEIQKRASMLSGKAKELASWNKKYPEQRLPRIVAIIDEFAELKLVSGKKIGDQAESLVTRIANLGRAVGVHLIVCTQRPATSVLPNAIKINMPLIIGARTQSSAQSSVIVDSGLLADLPLIPGRMVYVTGSTIETIQTPFISEDDIEECIRIARGRAAKVITLKGADPVIEPPGLLEWLRAREGLAYSDELHGLAVSQNAYRNFVDTQINLGTMKRLPRGVIWAEQNEKILEGIDFLKGRAKEHETDTMRALRLKHEKETVV